MKSRRTTDLSWEQLREEMVRLSQPSDFAPDEPKLAAMYAERARRLAQVQQQQREVRTQDTAVFRLEAELYAVDLHYVAEIVPLQLLVPVPGAPPFVLGVCSRRGEIVSVIDLERFLTAAQTRNPHYVVLLSSPSMTIGVAANEIAGIKTLDMEDMQPLPVGLSSDQARFLQGVFYDGIALLDAEELLASDRLIVDQP